MECAEGGILKSQLLSQNGSGAAGIIALSRAFVIAKYRYLFCAVLQMGFPYRVARFPLTTPIFNGKRATALCFAEGFENPVGRRRRFDPLADRVVAFAFAVPSFLMRAFA
jgi:hypothetical protein